VIDESTEFGARAARHLREEVVVWLTTVTPGGAPVPRPVWFIWDRAGSVVMYSQPKGRIRNLATNPQVTLNFDGDGGGGDIVVLSGRAELDNDLPPADRDPDYLSKYDDHIARIGMTPETFAREYSVPVQIRLTKLQGH
jgi:PPOX class probable F420-dependent enzyme